MSFSLHSPFQHVPESFMENALDSRHSHSKEYVNGTWDTKILYSWHICSIIWSTFVISHLILRATLWGYYYHPCFPNEKPETQTDEAIFSRSHSSQVAELQPEMRQSASRAPVLKGLYLEELRLWRCMWAKWWLSKQCQPKMSKTLLYKFGGGVRKVFPSRAR